jgi:hypothetical protein
MQLEADYNTRQQQQQDGAAGTTSADKLSQQQQQQQIELQQRQQQQEEELAESDLDMPLISAALNWLGIKVMIPQEGKVRGYRRVLHTMQQLCQSCIAAAAGCTKSCLGFPLMSQDHPTWQQSNLGSAATDRKTCAQWTTSLPLYSFPLVISRAYLRFPCPPVPLLSSCRPL